MWDNTKDKEQDFQWLVLGLARGTTVCVTDGLYDQNTARNLSGTGILLCCTNANLMLHGNFYEEPNTPSSYQGELLSRVAIHTILLTLYHFYDITSTSPKIYCNSIAAL